jgi:hypothetical protein
MLRPPFPSDAEVRPRHPAVHSQVTPVAFVPSTQSYCRDGLLPSRGARSGALTPNFGGGRDPLPNVLRIRDRDPFTSVSSCLIRTSAANPPWPLLARRRSDCFDLFFLRFLGLPITFSRAVSLDFSHSRPVWNCISCLCQAVARSFLLRARHVDVLTPRNHLPIVYTLDRSNKFQPVGPFDVICTFTTDLWNLWCLSKCTR